MNIQPFIIDVDDVQIDDVIKFYKSNAILIFRIVVTEIDLTHIKYKVYDTNVGLNGTLLKTDVQLGIYSGSIQIERPYSPPTIEYVELPILNVHDILAGDVFIFTASEIITVADVYDDTVLVINETAGNKLTPLKKIDIQFWLNTGTLKITRTSKLSEAKKCNHVIKKYVGFTDTFNYCDKCGEKQ